MSELEKKIRKDFGDNILVDGNYILSQDKKVIPITPKLDLITGGGIPEGSFVLLSSQPKVGKTSLSLDFASTAQKEEHGNREIYFYNVEARLKPRDLLGIPRLNIEKFHVIQSQPGKILHAADYLQICEQFINDKPNTVHIIDSFSALCTEAEMNADMSQMQRADGAKLLSKFCRKIANVLPVNNTILIGIVHLMANPSGYGKQYTEKSGFGVQYHSDVKLRATTMRPWKLSEQSNPIGQEVDWTCEYSSLGSPMQKTTTYLRYGEGYDKVQELASMGVDLGLIKKGGSWYTFSFLNTNGDEHKVQGVENVRTRKED
jgi:recombination protein RecA